MNSYVIITGKERYNLRTASEKVFSFSFGITKNHQVQKCEPRCCFRDKSFNFKFSKILACQIPWTCFREAGQLLCILHIKQHQHQEHTLFEIHWLRKYNGGTVCVAPFVYTVTDSYCMTKAVLLLSSQHPKTQSCRLKKA